MSHLVMRHNTYYASLAVPKDVRKKLGRARFFQTLKTSSRAVALRRSVPVVAHWKTLIDRARGEDGVSAEAMIYRDMLRKAKDAEEQALIKELVTDKAYEIEEQENTLVAKRFFEVATGQKTPIMDHVDMWLEASDIKPRTRSERRTALERLGKEYSYVEEIDRRAASEFVDGLASPNRGPATITKMVSAYSTYWKWLRDRGILAESHYNPWERQARKPKKSETIQRRPFTEHEAGKFMKIAGRFSNKYPDDLAIAQVMAVTGMRLEEVCSLDRQDVTIDDKAAWLEIKEGKTEAAARRIPVVEPGVMAQLRPRLNGSSGPLFSSLTETKYGDRSPAISKRLNRHLRNITKDPALVAGHSWRHRARTLMEHGDIAPWVCDWFLGHARPGIGLTVYSKGPNDEQLIEAAKAIALPKPTAE